MSLIPKNRYGLMHSDDGPTSLQRQMNRLFDDFFDDFGAHNNQLAAIPAVDIVEGDTSYKISAELPAMNAEDVDISINDSYLTIKGEKKEEKEEHDKNNTIVRRERHYGSYQRTIALPQNVDTSKADASFKNGVLHIEVPKKAEEQTKSRKIQIKQA
jgi:HSP20 family protein